MFYVAVKETPHRVLFCFLFCLEFCNNNLSLYYWAGDQGHRSHDGTRFLRYFPQDMGTSQHRMARHDQSRAACVGWRSSDLPMAIAPYHTIRVARLGSSWLKVRAKSSARVPKVARRRTRLRSWGAGRAVTSPKCRPDDLPRPSSSRLSQIARQISLMSYGRRTSNTNHVLFTSFRIEWTSGASAPECGVAGGGDGCHVGRPATIWDLRWAG